MKTKEALRPTEVEVIPQPAGALNRDFLTIIVGSTALGLGCMAAAVEALRGGAGGFTFQLSAGTLVAFAGGLAAALLYWKMAARSLLAVRIGAVLLLLAGVGGFLYPLRFVPSDKMGEIAIGLSFATCALSLGGCLLWRLKRFFEADAAAVEANQVN